MSLKGLGTMKRLKQDEFSASSLLVQNRGFPQKYVFCDNEDHIQSRCKTVSNIEISNRYPEE